MTIQELYTAFRGKTTIQKNETASKIKGAEIIFDACITDIGTNKIELETPYKEFYSDPYDNRYENYLNLINLKYDKEKFGRTLLSYQNFDDAKIVATLTGIDGGQSSFLPLFYLELSSISKLGTTRQSRYEKYEKEQNSFCFIATACYGDYNAPQVLVLRQFRDNNLLKSFCGKQFVKIYYTVSPFLASLISKSETLKRIVRKYFLDPIVTKLRAEKN